MIIRFPRTEDRALAFMVKVRINHPPPPYNWRTDGSVDPSDWVLDQLLKYSRKKLRRLCRKHALEPTGRRSRLVFRLWMHWRAKKLMIGEEYYGYGKGYRNTETPTCSCGYLRRDYIEGVAKRKLDQKVNAKKRTNGVQDGRQRFPRLK